MKPLSPLSVSSSIAASNKTVPPSRRISNVFLEVTLLITVVAPVLLVLGSVLLYGGVLAVVHGSPLALHLLLPLLACTLAVAVAALPNPMHALLSLIGVFLATVLFYIALGAEFIGLIFLIVYVGAVAILFLFVIMLLNVKSLTSRTTLIRQNTQFIAIIAGGLLFTRLAAYLVPATVKDMSVSTRVAASQESTSVDAVLYYVNYQAADVFAFASLYTEHSALFLLITIILLVAMLGAIVLATSTLEEEEPYVAFLLCAPSSHFPAITQTSAPPPTLCRP